MARGWYLNSLKGWKKDFEREQRQGRKRLETLRGMGHPCAADQEQLLNIRDGWIKQIDQEIARALPPALRPDVENAGNDVGGSR